MHRRDACNWHQKNLAEVYIVGDELDLKQLEQGYVSQYGKRFRAQPSLMACLAIGRKIKLLLEKSGPQTLRHLSDSSLFPKFDAYAQFDHFWQVIGQWLRDSAIDRMKYPDQYNNTQILNSCIDPQSLGSIEEVADKNRDTRIRTIEGLLQILRYVRSKSACTFRELWGWIDTSREIDHRVKNELLFLIYDDTRKKLRCTTNRMNQDRATTAVYN